MRTFVSRAEDRRKAEPLDVLVREAKALAMTGSSHVGIEVEMALDGGLHVLVDRIQIQQVLLNLIRNAVEAMQGRPRRVLSVSATASTCGGLVELAISDTGGGIHPSVFSKLFQPFQTTKPNGMGVGLSICRTIVEAHGGHICADTKPGIGSSFYLTLPRVADGGARRAA